MKLCLSLGHSKICIRWTSSKPTLWRIIVCLIPVVWSDGLPTQHQTKYTVDKGVLACAESAGMSPNAFRKHSVPWTQAIDLSSLCSLTSGSLAKAQFPVHTDAKEAVEFLKMAHAVDLLWSGACVLSVPRFGQELERPPRTCYCLL